MVPEDEEAFEIDVEEDDEEEEEEAAAAPPPPPAPAVSDDPSDEIPQGLTAQAAGFFVVLDKLLRATRLYEGRGELVDRLLHETAKKATPALAGGELTVRVTPVGLLLGSEEVTPSKSRLSEATFKLFCDGIRELSFAPGLHADDLRGLIDVLIADPRQGEDDYSTLLWKRELAHISFYATDTLQSGPDLGDAGQQELLGEAEQAQIQSAATEAAEEFVLSPDDLRMLKTDDRLAWVRECAAPMAVGQVNEATVQAARAAFATPFDHVRFLQMAVRAAEDDPHTPSPLVLDMFDSMVAGRDAEGAAKLLKAAGGASRSGGFAASSLYKGLLETERVKQLAPVFEREPDVLSEALYDAATESPDALVALLNELHPGEARDGLLGTLTESGVDLTSYYSRCITDENEEIVVGAIDALMGFGTEEATIAITQALGYTSTRVRRKALSSLVGHYPAEARVTLARALGDPDRENRLLALKVLSESEDRRAAGNILNRMEDSTFAQRDEAEQTEFIKALTRFKDPRTVPYFASVLAGVSLARTGKSLQRQLLAVEALAAIPGEEARAALTRSAKKWGLPKDVKKAAKLALSRMGSA
ncbi:MAG: hypothetical protein GY898_20480 [Proteobacteria bacterium]|nr:hypothetical protein [Pseudomonadota bacterium]